MSAAERLPVGSGGGSMRQGAYLAGADQQYRLWLTRDWSIDINHCRDCERAYETDRPSPHGDGASAPYVLFIGMNPSTADAYVNDPTIRREIAFTRRFGYASYVKVNVLDYRATKPATLLAPGVQPRSDNNLPTIKRYADGAALTIICWGKLPKSLRRYADDVLLALKGRELWCLGRNSDGSPKHPLYLAGDTPLERFR